MKILMISDLPPCTNHTGGLFLDRLCTYLQEDNCQIFAYIVKNPEVGVEIPEDTKSSIDFVFDVKPRENIGREYNAFLSFVYDVFITYTEVRRIRKRIERHIKKIKPDMIWGVVQGQTMTKLIRRVATDCQIEYSVQFYDPISWWFQANKVDKLTQMKVMKEYGRMISDSYCFIGASDIMAEDYKALYGCKKSVGIMMPFDKGDSCSKKIKRDDKTFVIAISGQLYARSTILAFLYALSLMNWEYEEKKIIFRIYGPEISFYGIKNAHIEYRGWIEQEQLLKELNEADLLYCPYRFDEGFREVATYSFPGKLSTYMKTGVPIMVHSPEYSSIVRFVKEYQSAYVLETVDPSVIVAELKKIIVDNNYDEMVYRANKTANDVLSDEITKKKIEYAMGIIDSI
ncbi:MAG: hypothetical protein K6D96_01945 [Acetatifactor sp.]|nr:hypothetical protein [Acetatifactor sp.]